MQKNKMKADIEILERRNASYQLKINALENELKGETEKGSELED